MEVGRENEVWSWGAGTDGQLGLGTVEDKHSPQLLPSFTSLSITSIACGGAHVSALAGGRVFTWGRGTSGQLGHGDWKNKLQPTMVKLLEEFHVIHISAGWNHSGFVSGNGCLLTCGDGTFGQLGHGSYNSHCSTLKVSYFESMFVKQIACGLRHSVVLVNGSSDDSVYTFGSGRHGQLGFFVEKSKRTINIPQLVPGRGHGRITTVAANGDQSAILCGDGSLHMWGKGFSENEYIFSPHLVVSTLKFCQVALGWNHALLLTVDGGVFMLGGTHHGILSNPKIEGATTIPDSQSECLNDKDYQHPLTQVSGVAGRKVILISAGAEHSALVTEDNQIMTWGWGEHGQLGLGDTLDQTIPQVLRLEGACKISCRKLDVFCGSGFTLTLRSSGS